MWILLAALLQTAQAKVPPAPVSAKVLYQMDPVQVAEFVPYKNPRVVLLKNDFASSRITNREALARLKGKQIVAVDLYYSKYRASESFKQPELNQARFDTLLKYLPRLARGYVLFNAFEQTLAKNESDAKKLFHGFAIEYLDPPDAASSSEELMLLDKFLSMDSLGHYETLVEEKTKTRVELVKKGYDPILKKYKEQNIVRKSKGLLIPRKPHLDTMITEVKQKPKIVGRKFVPPDKIFGIDPGSMSEGMFRYIGNRFDSTFLHFIRTYPLKEKTLIAVDVTGSMLPYTIQVCMWNRLKCKPAEKQRYVLFNDGDRKKDNQKKTGQVGGIYPFVADSAITFEKNLRMVMAKGFGGDCPENNVEAILKGIIKFPDTRRVLMIADSYAGVRDMELLNKVKVPVDVLLCGNGSYVHPHYLNMARSTGGKVFTMQGEIKELLTMKEGSTLLFGKARFLLKNGTFVPVY